MQKYFRSFATCLMAWSIVGLLYLAQDITRRLYWDEPEPFREVGFWVVRVLASAALTPFVLSLGRRWPIERHSWPRRVPVHLLFGMGFALARTALEVAVIYPMTALGSHPPALPWAQSFGDAVAVLLIFGFHTAVIAYWVALAIQASFHYFEKYQDREQAALRLELNATALRAEVAQARLHALKMQLQPHFLFNTLNAIVVLVRQQRVHEADQALTRFSDLLRALLDDMKSQEVPLSRELAYVRLYLGIEQMRFSDRLHVRVDVDPEILAAAVPHMSLQPIVENAVRHGIAPRTAGGTIEIQATRVNENLHIAVKDDGVGFTSSNSEGGHGLGLVNLRARLQQLYGTASELRITDRDGGGTSVTLILPYRSSALTEDEVVIGDMNDGLSNPEHAVEGVGRR